MSVAAALRQFVASKPLLARAMGNTGWLLGEQIPRKVAGLLVGTWIVRYLGPTQFGALTFAFTWVDFFVMLGALGLPSILVRELAAHPGDREEILGTSTALRILGSVAVIAGAIATIGLAKPDDSLMKLMVVIISLTSFAQVFDTIDCYFRAGLSSGNGVVPRTAAFVVFTTVKVGLLLGNASLVWFAVAGGGETVLAALGMAVVYRIQVGRFSAWKFSVARARSMLHASWPLVLSGLAVTLYTRIDIVMLGAFASEKEVGVYAAAETLAESWVFIPMAINSTLLPVLSEARKTSEALFEEHVERYYRFISGVALVVLSLGSVAGVVVIPTLLGGAYAASVPLFVAILWTTLFSCLGLARGAHWVVLGWTRLHMGGTIAGAVANIAANLVLIPRYGAWGAVIATAVSYWVAVFGWCLALKETRPTAYRMMRALASPRLW